MSATTKKKATPPDESSKPVKSAADEAAKAVKEIMQQAEAQAESLSANVSVTPVDVSGALPESDPTSDPGQADFIPGTRISDFTYLPERVYDEETQKTRRCSLPAEYHYVWVHQDKLVSFRNNTYRFCLFQGGQLSGLAARGLLGTGLYERTVDNHVRHGDCYLMYISQRGYKMLQEEEVKRYNLMTAAAESDVHNEGYRHGVRTFKEVDGQMVYN